MKQTFSLIFAGIMLFANVCFGQTLGVDIAHSEFKAKQIIPPAPEAAELGKYGNVPVSLYTGTPSISVPLYELHGTSLSLPISLGYNAGGFKPQEIATWVGSGWSLNAGGVITRSVLGLPDNEVNYYGTAAMVPPTNPNDYFPWFAYCDKLNNGTFETQPDIYYFNFAGHSGKFLIKPDHTVMQKEKSGLVITYCSSCTDGSFTITDEQGITYTFADAEKTRMMLNDADGAGNAATYNYSSSWYLTQITSADGKETISFDYYTTLLESLSPTTPVENESYAFAFGSTGAPGCTLVEVGSQSGSHVFSTPPQVEVQRKFLNKVSLNRNGTLLNYIQLESATGQRLDASAADDRVLNKVKLFSAIEGTNSMIKEFDLTYGYFTNNGNTYYKNRLRLDAVQEKGADGNTAKPPYLFTYYAAPDMPDRNFTKALDHWGFYNQASNTSLAPDVYFEGYSNSYGPGNYPAGMYGGHANREPSLAGTKETILNKIQYPTGGYTSFEYELNHADTRDIGGLRVYKITDYSPVNDLTIIKNYTYLKDDATSSGVADVPKYDSRSSFHHYAETPAFNASCEEIAMAREWETLNLNVSASSIFGLGSVNGSHIGYAQVTETQTDLSTNHALGKTVYKYIAHLAGSHDDDIANGDLLSKTVYDDQGNILTSTTNTYEYNTLDHLDNIEAKPAAGGQNNKYVFCLLSGTYYRGLVQAGYPTAYCGSGSTTATYIKSIDRLNINSVSAQRKLLKTQTDVTKDPFTGNIITNTKNLIYNNPDINAPSIIKQQTTGTEQVVTEKRYAGDYTGTDNSTGIVNLKGKNILGAEIESVQYRQNTDGSNKRYINGSITTYNPLLPYPSGLLRLEISSPLTAFQFSGNTTSFTYDPNYKPAGTFTYNITGNIAEQAKINDVVSAYIWGHNSSLPLAAVVNSPVSAIAYTSFETATTADWVQTQTTINNTTAVTGNRSCNLTTASKLAKQFTSAPAQQLKVSYWSQNGALTVTANSTAAVTVSTQGATHNGWTYYEHILPAATSLVELTAAAARTVDEVRLMPVAAQMSTSTYQPEVGKTSECTATNIVTYYEYDALARLSLVRDNDKNILKKICYNYAGQPENCAIGTNTAPQWRATGNSRCLPCPQNSAYLSTVKEIEEKDMNPNSAAPGATRWVTDPNGSCISPPDWIAHPELAYCQQTGEGIYTGMQVIPTFDGNPCSASYNQAGTPILQDYGPCHIITCNPACSAPEYKCNTSTGVCEHGTWSIIRVVKNATKPATWTCYWAWCFSDGSRQGSGTTTSSTACTVNCF